MTKTPVIGIIACLLPNFGIGFKGMLPWRLSKEMKYFKQVTTLTFGNNKQNVVIMGRKTWDSIPPRFKPLPNRINVVISRSFTNELVFDNELNCYKINSIDLSIKEIEKKINNIERIYLIGGGEIYNTCFNIIDNWLITKIKTLPDTTIPEMDTFLDSKRLNSHFIENKTGLKQFLPPGVELAASEQTDPELPFTQQEKGYEFGFSLYDRK